MWRPKREPFHVPVPLLRHVVPLNDGNCRHTIPVAKGRCARDALRRIFHICVFKWGKHNSTTLSRTNWCRFPPKSRQACHNIQICLHKVTTYDILILLSRSNVAHKQRVESRAHFVPSFVVRSQVLHTFEEATSDDISCCDGIWYFAEHIAIIMASLKFATALGETVESDYIVAFVLYIYLPNVN